MLSKLIRAGMILAAAAGVAQAQYDALWSRIVNNSGQDQTLIITDSVATVGNIFVGSAAGRKEATLARRGDKVTLANGSTTWVYFDTTMGSVAIWFKIGNTEYNVGFSRLGTVAKNICLQERLDAFGSPITLNAAGFMNTKGPVWLTLDPFQ